MPKKWLPKEKIESLRAKWRKTVYDCAEEIDPDSEYTWDGLALGWMLASGIPLDQAQSLLLDDQWDY